MREHNPSLQTGYDRIWKIASKDQAKGGPRKATAMIERCIRQVAIAARSRKYSTGIKKIYGTW